MTMAWWGEHRRPAPQRGGRLVFCGLAAAVGVVVAVVIGAGGAAAPRGPVHFQPGVQIDWQRREVLVQTRVVLRAGALEFLACWPGKEHESVVRCEAAAGHVYMALGLIGVAPGHPPRLDPQTGEYAAPAGDLVDIRLRWAEDERSREVDAYEWLREVEYGRAPLARPWVFGGSLRRPDGSLATDVSGVGVALVDFPDSLICYARRYPSRMAELWVEAATERIPREGTVVQLVLRAAERRPPEVRLDFRGVVWLNGRYCTPADLADILRLERQLDPTHVQAIEVRGALGSDVHRVARALVEAGFPANGFRFMGATAPGGAPRHGD